ncbi:hypothetical protein P9112_000347 [Eukaryota sp. TZLM1-RC]
MVISNVTCSPSFINGNTLHNCHTGSLPDLSSHSSIPQSGVKAISRKSGHTLLLTHSGEVYGWGRNFEHQVLNHGAGTIKSPIKIPINNIVSISTANDHSLALSSEGKLFGWGLNINKELCFGSSRKGSINPLNTSFSVCEVYGGDSSSFVVTQEGQVVKFGSYTCFETIQRISNIQVISVDDDSFVAIDNTGDFFFCDCFCLMKFQIVELKITNSIALSSDFLFIIDANGEVWEFNKGNDDVPFNKKPTKVPGLNNIVSVSGYGGIYAAIDNDGKVFVWGELSKISNVYENHDEPICIEAFDNIEGISVGHDFLFAYNKNTVWAWGRNDKGQLGTGDLIDRPQPVKVFGSEILGSFQYPRQPLDRMFSGLIKLVYWEYLNYLQTLFGNHPYVKARFYLKCGISNRVAQFAQEVCNAHPIQNKMFLKDPQELNLNENICDLRLRLSTDYIGPEVINTRIKKLDVYYDEVDLKILSFFPNVEILQLGSLLVSDLSLNLAHLLQLKSAEIHCKININQLPTSLVKLVLKHDGIQVDDLSYLTSLKELVVTGFDNSEGVLEEEIPLPQSIIRLEVYLLMSIYVEIQLPKLRELIIHFSVPANITEQSFPDLKFIQSHILFQDSLQNSSLSPTKFINQGLVKCVKLIRSQYLVELSCFPWWIQYSAERYLIDIFRDYVDENKQFV